MGKVAKHQPIKLWGSYLSTIFSIALVLFVLGLLMVLGYHSYRYTTDIKENIIYNVILSPATDQHEVAILNKMLNQKDEYPYIKAVNYISKDEAAHIFTDELGDNFVDFLGYNPLFPSFEVNMISGISAEQTNANIELFKESLKSYTFVTDVVYQETTVSEVNEIIYNVGWVLLVFTALLLFVAIVVINNTIKIVIYSKRYTIKTMQLVGAKRSFIIRPFLHRSLIYGLLGSVIATLLLAVLVFISYSQLNIAIAMADVKMPYVVIIGIVVLMGMAISYFSTYFSIHYYLNHKDEQLY
jgi:cell division transport system permease protein